MLSISDFSLPLSNGMQIVQMQTMTKQGQDIAYFLSFCIEQYMNDKGLNREQTMTLFSQYGVLDYLAAHFEILHTQSRQWIVEDIDDYIQNRKGATE